MFGYPYKIAAGATIGCFLLVLLASHYGWGVPTEASTSAQGKPIVRSVRSGSTHFGGRSFFGGGPRFGK